MPAQEPLGHRLSPLRVARASAVDVVVGQRRAAHGQDPVEDRVGLGLDPVGERLDVPRAAQRVGDVDHARLLHDHLLGAQGDLRSPLRRQRESLVQSVGVHRVRAAEHPGECLDRGTHDIVVGLLGGERDAGGLGVKPQRLRLVAGGAVAVAHPASPDPAGSAEASRSLRRNPRGRRRRRSGRGEMVGIEPRSSPIRRRRSHRRE